MLGAYASFRQEAEVSLARSQPVSTTDTQARCTHFKALGFMARPQSLETRRGQTWPLPLGCQQDHALISARPLCLLPHPPSYVSSRHGPGVLSSLLVPRSRRASGADRRYVGFTHFQPKQVPAEIGKSKAPPGPQVTRCRDTSPQPPVMLGLRWGGERA